MKILVRKKKKTKGGRVQGCPSQCDTLDPPVLSLASPGACLCSLTDVYLFPNDTVTLPNFFLDTFSFPLASAS